MGSNVPPITPIRRILTASPYPHMVLACRWSVAVQLLDGRATIRDMTSVPDRARVRLTGISSRAYEHPADRSALVALRKLTGFDTLLRKLFGLFNERAFRLTYLASAVRVSERQFPHIHEMVRTPPYSNDLPDAPDAYVT